jgi:hypothetical protein
MAFQITDQWIIETMNKNDWCLNTIVFVYPDGAVKEELNFPPGEKVCASITDALYLSTRAVYLRGKAGKYTRLLWADIDDMTWSLRKVDGQTVQAISYKVSDGCKIVTPMPFTFVPKYFGQVIEACFAELSPGGKTCRLPGPDRLKSYAHPVEKDARWLAGVLQDRIVWARELLCPCESRKGFSVGYLGRRHQDGLIAGGDLRQRVEGKCNSCGKTVEVFDAFRNGYNAVICGESNSEPAGRLANSVYECQCGSKQFSIGVVALYDVGDEDLAGFSKAKRSEGYGWFSAYATCHRCKTVIEVIDYETA